MEENQTKIKFRNATFQTVLVIALLFVVFGLENAFDLNLYWLGVKPREMVGLLGIVTSPIKHHDLSHIINNSLLLVILLIGFFLHVPAKSSLLKLLLISLVCNIWLWIGGRSAWHFGASGVVYGLFFFMLTLAIRFRKRELVLFILSCLVVSAGFFVGLFPTEPTISYEGHIFGGIAGVLIAFFEKKPKPPKPQISNVNFSRNAKFEYQYHENKNNDN